jgi:uncharacterized membrane protein YesL
MTATETGRRSGPEGFGSGPLARAAALIHTLLVVQVLFLLTGAPGLVVLVLLDREPGNIPLVAACAAPVGPAASAALYALRRRGHDLTELTPTRDFLRGYRMNAAATLKLWLPWLAWSAVLGINLAHPQQSGVPPWWRTALVALAVTAALWQVNALVITSLFAFRARDTARLAAYFLLRRPRVTLGAAGTGVLAGAVIVLTSEAVLALVAVVFLAFLLHACRPMCAEIEERFTR